MDAPDLTAGDIRDAIHARRPETAVRVEQTGGGTATIYLGAFGPDGHATVAIGPGRYNWADPWQSPFYADGDTAVGPDDDGTVVPAYPTSLVGIVDAAIAVLEPDTSGLDDHRPY